MTERTSGQVADCPTRSDNGRRSNLKPALASEWQVVLMLREGTEVPYPFATEAEARFFSERFHHARWRIERRLCTPWVIEGQVMQTRTVVEPEAAMREDGGDD